MFLDENYFYILYILFILLYYVSILREIYKVFYWFTIWSSCYF